MNTSTSEWHDVDVDTMKVEVLLLDAEPGGVYEVVSYTVFANGRLELRLADGSTKTWDLDWMDVRPYTAT